MCIEEAINRLKYINNNYDCNNYYFKYDLDCIAMVLNNLEIKDKVIQEMAKALNTYDIDEDICRKFGKNKDCNDFTNENLCINCIKEYFYKKVEEENE